MADLSKFRVGTIFDCGCGECSRTYTVKKIHIGKLECTFITPESPPERDMVYLPSVILEKARNIRQPGPMSLREIFMQELATT